MPTYDIFPRFSTSDTGSVGYMSGAAPATGLIPAPIFDIRVPFVTGAGPTAEFAIPITTKCRVIDAGALTTTAIAGSTVQVFTGTGGTGAQATSAISTAALGRTRDALGSATQVFAAGSTLYVRQSGGATLAGGELNITIQLEQ